MAGIDKTLLIFHNGKYVGDFNAVQVIPRAFHKDRLLKNKGTVKVEFTSIGELSRITDCWDYNSIDREILTEDRLLTINMTKAEYIQYEGHSYNSNPTYNEKCKLLFNDGLMMIFYTKNDVNYHWIWDIKTKETWCGIGSYGHFKNVFTHFMHRGYGDEFEKELVKKCYNHIVNEVGYSLIDHRMFEFYMNSFGFYDKIKKSYESAFKSEYEYGNDQIHTMIFKNGKYVKNLNEIKEIRVGNKFKWTFKFGSNYSNIWISNDRGFDIKDTIDSLPKFNLGVEYKYLDHTLDHKLYLKSGRFYFSKNINFIMIEDNYNRNKIFYIWDKNDTYIIYNTDSCRLYDSFVYTNFLEYKLPNTEEMLKECYDELVDKGTRDFKEGGLQIQNQLDGIRTDEFEWDENCYSKELKDFIKRFKIRSM